MRRIAINYQFVLVLPDSVLNHAHRRQNILPMLIRRKLFQSFRRGKFKINAHTVRKKSQLPDNIRIGSGNSLNMNVSLKPILRPQKKNGPVNQLHSIRGTIYNPGA